MDREKTTLYTVVQKVLENSQTVTLYLSNEDVHSFIPGQYIIVYPYGEEGEGKAYSLSGAPHQGFSITVKMVGEYSTFLSTISPGDVFIGSFPYGYFYSESIDTDMVMLAGGIGVAPFRSMIVDALHKNPERKITLYQSVKRTVDIVFQKDFERLSAVHKTFSLRYHITGENAGFGMTKGRISPKKVVEEVGVSHTDFFLCGSVAFVRDMWKGLKEAGVGEDQIYTEAFF